MDPSKSSTSGVPQPSHTFPIISTFKAESCKMSFGKFIWGNLKYFLKLLAPNWEMLGEGWDLYVYPFCVTPRFQGHKNTFKAVPKR